MNSLEPGRRLVTALWKGEEMAKVCAEVGLTAQQALDLLDSGAVAAEVQALVGLGRKQTEMLTARFAGGAVLILVQLMGHKTARGLALKAALAVLEAGVKGQRADPKHAAPEPPELPPDVAAAIARALAAADEPAAAEEHGAEVGG